MGENRRFFAKTQNFQSIIGRVRQYFLKKKLMQKFLARTIVIEWDRAVSIFKNDPFSLHPNIYIRVMQQRKKSYPARLTPQSTLNIY
jgi:hypothetical protein